jgi:HAD superfamily hydrolase (TIGR01509 family)
MIRALVLDFDGLILDTESSVIAAYAEIHADHGVAFDEREFVRSVGLHDYTFDPWHGFAPDADRDRLEELRRARNLEMNRALETLPGVRELIADALSAGLRLGLASNSSRGHCGGHLERIGLIRHFSVLGCRGDAPQPKPEPDLYRHVVETLGVEPSEAIAFEDSHTGARAAARAGLHVVAVPNRITAGHDFSEAHLVLQTLEGLDLRGLLARFGDGR